MTIYNFRAKVNYHARRIFDFNICHTEVVDKYGSIQKGTEMGVKGIRKDYENGEVPQEGEYGFVSDGNSNKQRYCVPPKHPDLIASLDNHEVSIAPDGTWNVTPSILVKSHTGESWHGYLYDGEFLDA